MFNISDLIIIKYSDLNLWWTISHKNPLFENDEEDDDGEEDQDDDYNIRISWKAIQYLHQA